MIKLKLFCLVMIMAVSVLEGYSADPSVYLVGSIKLKENTIGVYWKDGVKTELSVNGKDTYAKSIAVLNGDVYVTGYYFERGNQACYWKNGQKFYLEQNKASQSTGNGIAISGKDVYISWGYKESKSKEEAYLKNGKPVIIKGGFEGESEISIYSIYSSGINVYVSGSEFMNSNLVGRVWKNNVLMPLDFSTCYRRTEVKAVYVSGSDEYIAVIETDRGYNCAVSYFKNGVRTLIEKSDRAIELEAILVQ